jgi:Spy/CpxP family protein refolding chaperone
MEKLESNITIAAILVFVLMFVGSCHPRHPRHWYGPSGYRSPEKRVAWLKEEISERLELDDAQQARLDEITSDIVEKGEEMRAVRTSIRETFISEFSKDEINKENLTRIFSDNKNKIDEMILLFTDRLVEFHQMLRPEQRAKLVAEIEKHRKRWQRHHRHW